MSPALGLPRNQICIFCEKPAAPCDLRLLDGDNAWTYGCKARVSYGEGWGHLDCIAERLASLAWTELHEFEESLSHFVKDLTTSQPLLDEIVSPFLQGRWILFGGIEANRPERVPRAVLWLCCDPTRDGEKWSHAPAATTTYNTVLAAGDHIRSKPLLEAILASFPKELHGHLPAQAAFLIERKSELKKKEKLSDHERKEDSIVTRVMAPSACDNRDGRRVLFTRFCNAELGSAIALPEFPNLVVQRIIPVWSSPTSDITSMWSLSFVLDNVDDHDLEIGETESELSPDVFAKRSKLPRVDRGIGVWTHTRNLNALVAATKAVRSQVNDLEVERKILEAKTKSKLAEAEKWLQAWIVKATGASERFTTASARLAGLENEPMLSDQFVQLHRTARAELLKAAKEQAETGAKVEEMKGTLSHTAKQPQQLIDLIDKLRICNERLAAWEAKDVPPAQQPIAPLYPLPLSFCQPTLQVRLGGRVLQQKRTIFVIGDDTDADESHLPYYRVAPKREFCGRPELRLVVPTIPSLIDDGRHTVAVTPEERNDDDDSMVTFPGSMSSSSALNS